MIDSEWLVQVTRIRSTPAGVDQYGEPIPGQLERTVLPPALFAPASSAEPLAPGRAPVISTASLYWRGQHPDVQAGDQVEVDGITWEVEGRPSTWPKGLVAELRASTGRGMA
ncbi:hypothetical protein I6B53_03275 [Schaalia sp. 19OD2882]|uniref:hypothetical protein n=1 Tax=Schaalia sp. 19OD2882 TaxID=2794089 RepID=UPI001C1EE921|nr:hypothetical protein [Schaalia sp. 19OD2882]QWW20132.1 hypothetical protein I6B53_03275 [Schaalia sp. 19OD2882]